MRQKNWQKSDTPVKLSFSIPETFRYNKRSPLNIFFSETKIFRQIFVIPLLWFTRKIALNQWVAPELLRNFHKNKNGPLTDFSVLLDKKSSTIFGDTLWWFWWYTGPSGWTDELRQPWFFSVSYSFRPQTSPKENSQFRRTVLFSS